MLCILNSNQKMGNALKGSSPAEPEEAKPRRRESKQLKRQNTAKSYEVPMDVFKRIIAVSLVF